VSITKTIKSMAFTNEFRIEFEAERQINEASIREPIAFLKGCGMEAYSAKSEDGNKDLSRLAGFRVSIHLSSISKHRADTISQDFRKLRRPCGSRLPCAKTN
jgi:hypothetical protein